MRSAPAGTGANTSEDGTGRRATGTSMPNGIAVTFPSALPQIFAGLRVGLALAFIMIVISEMVGGSNGLGYAILSAQRTFSIPEMYAGIVLLAILGYGLNALFTLLERRVLAWHLGSTAVTR